MSKIKFDDYSFLFSFLYECEKTGKLTPSDKEKIKNEFINQNPDILMIFQKSETDNHQNLIELLKNFVNIKTLHKNLSQGEKTFLKAPTLDKNSILEKEQIIRTNKKFATQIQTVQRFLY